MKIVFNYQNDVFKFKVNIIICPIFIWDEKSHYTYNDDEEFYFENTIKNEHLKQHGTFDQLFKLLFEDLIENHTFYLKKIKIECPKKKIYEKLTTEYLDNIGDLEKLRKAYNKIRSELIV